MGVVRAVARVRMARRPVRRRPAAAQPPPGTHLQALSSSGARGGSEQQAARGQGAPAHAAPQLVQLRQAKPAAHARARSV